MEISLIEIKEHVKKYIEVITTVIDVGVGVVDKNMKRVSSTGLYIDEDGEEVLGSVYKNTLETGSTNVIENPRQHCLCIECIDKQRCKETLEISTPIYCNGEIEGVLGLVCFTEEQKNKILSDVNSYLNFTKQIAEFIGMKFNEYKESLLQKEKEETLNQILNNMTKGVIVTNSDNEILIINQIGMKKLKLVFSPVGKKIKIISQNDYIMNEEIFKLIINEKEYTVSGKKFPLNSISKKKEDAFIFDDIQKINKNIVEVSNQYNRITLDDIHGKSQAILSLKEYIQAISNSNSTVLITGESGTGKELIARSIHSCGNRKDKPFVVINCSAIPDSLLESELFGYVKGAFTGANNNGHMGKFELANTGVIFLDEIGDMPLYLQAKLLRVLQEKKIERIGSNKSIDLDIKIIAATNADLKQKIKEKKFREDLYYRLNVIPIQTHPLRERKEDIEPIVEELIKKYSLIANKTIKEMDREILDLLLEYDWPGNIRELENIIELMMNTCGNNEKIVKNMLPENILKKDIKENIIKEEKRFFEREEEILFEEFEKLEKEYIIRSLKKYGNSTESKKMISEKMNIGLTTLYRKLKKFNIDK